LITRDGLSIAEASRRLSISPKTLANRVSRAKGKDLSAASADTPLHMVTDAEAELSRLRRENAELRMERDILNRTRQTYGALRLQRELAADGFAVSLGTLKRVRRELGLRCVQRKKRFRVTTTDSGHQLPVVPNRLAQDFKAARPDEVWTADITYVPTAEGWLYVAAIKDLFAGEIVGRSFGARMTTDLVVRAFEQAVSARRPAAGLIHHSDRGSQYCSHEYHALLGQHGIRASMSSKGNYYDNAPVESFWGTLKTELVHHRRYRSRAEAAGEIAEYIDLFYNRQRRQARLGYLSPVAYTQQFMQQQRAA
jgi:putative transposase